MNSPLEIRSRLISFLREDPFYKETLPLSFDDDYNLVDSGVLDSIGILNLIVFLESQFNISIGIDELSENNFLNICQIVKYIEFKIQQK
jgi:acyl carrier protein